MKDDIFKKLQNLLTGSAKITEKIENSAKEEQKDPLLENEEMVNNFMNQILEATWVEEELKNSFAPSYHLSKKEKSYWLLNVSLKILTNIKGGIEIIPVEAGEKTTICMIGHSMYSIPNDLLICSGWN